MDFFKRIATKLGKAMTPDEMKQIKGGASYGCGVCGGEYVRPACHSSDPIFGGNCTCQIPGWSCA